MWPLTVVYMNRLTGMMLVMLGRGTQVGWHASRH